MSQGGGGGASGIGASPHQGDVIAGRYSIDKFIGRGGMAEVFAGTNLRTQKHVALKWIRPALAHTPEALARFKREALAAGRIDHPNVVTVFDVVEHDGSTWLVMELLEGEPLSEIVRRRRVLPVNEAIALLIPAMRGVAAAHARGVVHRDIKPENIFICQGTEIQRGEAKVLDFGVSKLFEESADDINITRDGNLVGTPIYMAPELVRGSREVDKRADVYALGVVLYELLAGRAPYQGEAYTALVVEIATTEPPPLRALAPHVSLEVENIVARAMARDLEKRFHDVPSFIRALEDLLRTSRADTTLGGSTPLTRSFSKPAVLDATQPMTFGFEVTTQKVRPPLRLRSGAGAVAAAVAAAAALLLVALLVARHWSASGEAIAPPARESAPPGFIGEPLPAGSEQQAEAAAAARFGGVEQAVGEPARPGDDTTAAGSTGVAARPGAWARRHHQSSAKGKVQHAAAAKVERPAAPPAAGAAPAQVRPPPSRAGRLSVDDF